MSCMVTIVAAPVTRANAAPTASATPSSSWSGTTPLMSYALAMLARSPNAGPAPRDPTVRPPRASAPPSLTALPRPRAQHPQVAPASDLDALADGLLLEPAIRPRPRLGLHHRVRERFEVIGAILDRFHRQPHHVPAARCDQPGGVLLAQVVAVRLDVGG